MPGGSGNPRPGRRLSVRVVRVVGVPPLAAGLVKVLNDLARLPGDATLAVTVDMRLLAAARPQVVMQDVCLVSRQVSFVLLITG